MDFAGLSDDDLGNVRALNRLFLHCVTRLPELSEPLNRMDVPLREWVAALSARQFERLASSPFLLFSLREHDGDYWEELLGNDQNGELFTPRLASDRDFTHLVVSSLSFLWQLARGNPYAARVISSASLYWCETLGERTLVSLLARAAHRPELLQPRFADHADVWRKLLSTGVSAEKATRVAAQLTAMQTMLTRTPNVTSDRLRAAACRMPAPRTR